MRIMRHAARSAVLGTPSAVLAIGLVALSGMVAAAQGPTPAPAAAIKLGYLRGQDVLAQTPGRADLEAQFNKEVDSARALEKVWGDSMNAMVGEYARVEATLTADQKTARQAALRERQTQFTQRGQQLEQQVQADNQRMIQPVLQRVSSIIDELRQEGGYTMIFDVQAQGGGVVSVDKNLDLTDVIVARLKAAGPVSVAPAAPGRLTPTKPTPGPTSAPSGVTRPKTQ